MRRRRLVSLMSAAVAAPVTGHAQPTLPLQRIGVLREATPDEQYRAFVGQVARTGRIEGTNLTIEPGRAGGPPERGCARELVVQQVAVIFAPTP